MVGDPRMSIYGWKQLALWSLKHSCLKNDKFVEENDEYHKAKAIFLQQWHEWCRFVVEKYGPIADGMKDLVNDMPRKVDFLPNTPEGMAQKAQQEAAEKLRK